MFPVPLNSSKMPSSIREPVSTSALAMIVSEPPSSMLRAAPKNRRGGYSAAESMPPDRILPRGRHREVVGAGETRQGVEDDRDVLARLGQALGALQHELGDLDVLVGRLVERRVHDLGRRAPCAASR